MSLRCLVIVIALAVFGCESNPAVPTSVGSDEDDTTPSGTTVPPSQPGPAVARPAFKVMTYNVQLANFGAPNTESRKPMIVEIIRLEAPSGR